MKKLSSQGFSVVEVLLVVAVVGILGFVGWSVWRNNASNSSENSALMNTNSQPKPSEPADVKTSNFKVKAVELDKLPPVLQSTILKTQNANCDKSGQATREELHKYVDAYISEDGKIADVGISCRLGGARYLFVETNGSWELVSHGHMGPTCEVVQEHQVPVGMLTPDHSNQTSAECYDSKGVAHKVVIE